MTNERKNELVALLSGAKPKERKAYPLKIDLSLFERVETLSNSSGIKNVNSVLNALIELGLAEYEKNK